MPYSENAPSSEKISETTIIQEEIKGECYDLEGNIRGNQNTTSYETQGKEDPEISDPKLSDIVFDERYETIEIQGPGDDLPHIVFREHTDGYRELQQLEEWCKNRYNSEYTDKRIRLEQKYYKKDEKLKRQYVRYELLMFCLQKYSEEVNQKHQNIINEVYGSEDEYKKAMKKASKVFDKIQKIINNTYSGIQTDIQEISKVFDKIEKQRQGWGINNEKAAEGRYKAYQEQKQKLENEYHIKELQNTLNINPQTPEEARQMGENLGKILEFIGKDTELKKKYNISNYEHYLNNKIFLINQYGKDKFFSKIEKIEQYKQSLNEIKKGKYEGFDFDKYQLYLEKRKALALDNHFNNISQFQDILTISTNNERFPITLGDLKTEEFKRIQAEQDNERRRHALKESYPFWYHAFNNLGALRNGIIKYTLGTGFELGAMVCNLWHSPEEMCEVYERKNNWIDTLSMQRSKVQTAPIYSPETGFNITRDNTPGAVIDSVVGMYTLIYTGGFFEGGLQTLGAGAKLAAGGGLFTSGLIYQLGSSYEEGFKAGLTGPDLLKYATLSSSIQAGLELVSPNRFILGKGNKVTKQLIADILKNGGKETYVQVGKLFLKNTGLEIFEENVQEALQLSAGNLINMIANDQYKLGEDGLNVDWDRKNFAATVLITTLTTGFASGVGFQPHQQNRTELMNKMKNNPDLYKSFGRVLQNAIDGEVTIPGATIEDLKTLKKELSQLQQCGDKLNQLIDENSQFIENFSTNGLDGKTNRENLKHRIITQYKEINGEELDISDIDTLKIIDTYILENRENWEDIQKLLEVLTTDLGVSDEITFFILETGYFGKNTREIWLKHKEEWLSQRNNNSEYFDGKTSRFHFSKEDALANSEFMDESLENISQIIETERENNPNISEKELEEKLKEPIDNIIHRITNQYNLRKSPDARPIKLGIEDIFSILDAHEQEGPLGEITIGQLHRKVKILDETITDENVRRFLLEGGFCGKIEEVAPNKIKSEYQSGDIKVIFDNGTIQHVKTQHANPDNKDKYCFENEEQIKEVSELFGEELAEFIEEELINTVNWEAGENKNKYILVETEDPQFKYLMVQVQLKEDKTFRVASFYTANQQQIEKHDRNLRMKVDKKRPEKSDSQQTKETQNKGTENNETNNRVYDLNTVYTDIIHTPFMEGLNETLTTNAELFMEIAYLPEGNKKLQFKQVNEKTIQVLYDGKIITRESFLSTQGKKEWDEIIKLPLVQQYEKFKNLCKREGRRSFLNLLDYNHTFSGEQMLQILLDGKRLDDAEATKKLNNIFQNTLKYCIGEDIGASFIGKYFSNLLKSDYQHLNNNGITPNTTTLTHTLNLYQEKKGNYERNKQQLNHQIQSYIDNNQEIPEALKTAKENLEKGAPSLDMLFSIDGKETVEKLFDELKEKNMSDSDRNKMNFFLRTLFIMSQIENDPTFQDKEERSKDIKQNYLEEFSKRIEEENKKKPEEERIGLTLLENTKTAESTATKISKAKEYACIEDFWDIIRYTYQLESTGEPIKDTQNLINLIGKFSEELIKKQGNGAKEIIFNSKFKGLFDTDAQGNYLYIGSYTVYENYTAITTKDGHTFKIRQKPKHTSGGKATSGEGYKDIKITYEINGIKFELKFVLSERAKNNEKGTSNHDIMRMLENINKTTRKYGLISEEYIHQKIDRIWEDLLYIYKDKTIFYELYNDKALGCKKDSDFSTFDPKNPQDMIKLKEKFQQYVLGKYRKVGEHNGHTYYVYSKEVYLEDVYQNYLKTLKQKDQPLTYEVRLREQLNGGKLPYFDGKISKLRIGIEQARKNSKLMDEALKFIQEDHTEIELQTKIDQLKDIIKEQYKIQTGEEIKLTDDQILSILDAHEKGGTLGKLTQGQVREEVKTLQKTITDPMLRRFLLESGFCGSTNCAGYVKGILHPDETVGIESIDEVLKTHQNDIRRISTKLIEIKDKDNNYDEDSDDSIDNRTLIYESAFQGKRENRKYAVIVIYDEDGLSQHIAYIDNDGNFYDQNGLNGPIRYQEDIEDLLDEYKKDLGGKAYYKLYSLTESAETIVAQGLKDLENEQEN